MEPLQTTDKLHSEMVARYFHGRAFNDSQKYFTQTEM